MSHWSPCKRREFIRRLRALGFDGPFSGTRHQFMTFVGHRLSRTPTDYSIERGVLDSSVAVHVAGSD